MAEGTIKIKLVRSPICTPEKHKRVVKGLGPEPPIEALPPTSA